MTAPVDTRPTGELRLGIRAGATRSTAPDVFHRGAIRVIRPLYLDDSGQVSFTLINVGGGYLGADEYDIDIHVAAGASLLLTTQSATKVYRTPQGPALQRLRVDLGAGAVLESIPDQVIVYREGSYRQSTVVTMHPDASYVAAEVVTPGWSPTGARFAYDELRLRTRIDVRPDDGPARVFALDHLRLVPDASTTGIGIMEGASHLGQLLVADRRVDDVLVDEIAALMDDHDCRGAVSRLGDETEVGMSGLVVRTLGDGTEPLTAVNLAVMDLLRHRWRDQGPIRLRKY